MIVISDTSPISNLATIGQIDLLRQIYGEVIIPEMVYQEIINGGVTEPATLAVQSLEWIKTGSVNNLNLVRNLQGKLDPGEAEAIVLALELNAELLIVDERKGRKQATSLGLKITGTLGVLFRAKQLGLILSVKPLLDELINSGFWVSSEIYQQALALVGEERDSP